MLLYNVTTEACFSRCVNNFNTRKLGEDEVTDCDIKSSFHHRTLKMFSFQRICVERCSGKYINFLNKVMSSYIVAQQEIVVKRIAESQNEAQAFANSQPELNQPS